MLAHPSALQRSAIISLVLNHADCGQLMFKFVQYGKVAVPLVS